MTTKHWKTTQMSIYMGTAKEDYCYGLKACVPPNFMLKP